MTEPLSLVFLPASGAAQDAELLAEFRARLAPDVGNGLFRITTAPPEAGLCVLLLPASPDLVGERSLLESALAVGRKHERPRAAQLMVLHLRPHEGTTAAFAGLTMLPADGRAVTEWPRRDDAWDDAVRCLRAIAVRGYLAPPRPATPPLALPSAGGEAPSFPAGLTREQLLAQLRRGDVGGAPPQLRVAASPAVEGPFHVPVPRDPSLIGREATIAEIAKRLHAHDPASRATPLVLLQGPAGAGMTAVVVEYAHRHRSAYPGGVFWLDLSAGEEGYRVIVGQLGLPARPNAIGRLPWPMDLPELFSRRTGWLLVIDAGSGRRSLDAAALVGGFAGWPHRGHVLVAASDDFWSNISSEATVSLAPLDDTSGAAILCAAAGRPMQAGSSEAEAAVAVTGALGGELAAVQFAGAYLAASPEVSFKAYLDLLTEAPVAREDEEQAGAAQTIMAPQRAFAESWRTLTPAARDVFRILMASRRKCLSPRRLALLTGLDDEAMLAATAQLRRLRFVDEEPLPTALQAREGVEKLAGDALGNTYLFARDRVDSLLSQLEDLGLLQREIAGGGAALLLAELRSISTSRYWKRRTALHWLDAAWGSLAGWDPVRDPDRMLVQVRDWAFETGASELELRAERALQAGARPWLRRRTATSPSPGRVLGTHDGPVTTVLLSPDGRLALSGSEDGTARCWDLALGAVTELRGHHGPVRALALAPDAQLAITASDDGTLKVWALPAGTERSTLEWHVAGVHSVAITSDGRQAVSAAHDGHLCLWDLTTGAELRSWYATSANGATVSALVATPDDPRLVAVWSDGQMRRLRPGTGSWIDSSVAIEAAPAPLATIAGVLAGDRRALAVDPLRSVAVTTSSAHDLLVWDVGRGELRSALPGHTGSILCAELSADGEHAASGSTDWTVRLWDLARGVLPLPNDLVVSAATMHDAGHTVSLTFGGALALWETATGRLLRTLQTLPSGKKGARFVTALPGSRVLVTNPGGLEIWDLDAGRRVASIAESWAPASSVVASADGRRVAVAAKPKAQPGERPDSRLFLLDLDTGERLGAAACDYPAQCLALLDEARLLVTDPEAGTVRCVDFATGATIRSFAVPDLLPGPLLAAPQGRRMASATKSAVLVVDVDSGEVVLTIPLAAGERDQRQRGPCMAITPDAQLLCLVTGTHEISPHVSSCEVALHEIPSGRVVARLALPVMPSVCSLSPDGSTVVLGAGPRAPRSVMRGRGRDSHYGWFEVIIESQPRLYFVDHVR